MRTFVIRWLITTLAVFLATGLDTGIHVNSFVSLLCAGLLLGVLNALVRPLLMLLTLPVIVLTLGFFILVLNAFMLLLVGSVVPGFSVTNFGAAFLGSIIISLVSWLLKAFYREFGGHIRIVAVPRGSHTRTKAATGRVIEVDAVEDEARG